MVEKLALPHAAIPGVLALGRAHGATAEGYSATGRYLAEERNDYITRHEVLLGAGAEIVPSLAEAGELVRIQWVVPHARWPALRAAAPDALEGVAVHEGRSPKMPDVIFAAVVHADVSKAWGVARAAALLEVPLARVAMIGDGNNDIPVFSVVGTSFATADGVETARAAAAHIVPGPREGGVADAIAHLIAASR